MAQELTAERLRELLHYDPETGMFTRLVSTWVRWKPGCAAGGADRLGYSRILVDGRSYQASRLAWLYMHGAWPAQHIDHINGNPADNRLANLRDVSRSQNMKNRRRHRNNRSGVKGIGRHNGKWRARIHADGKSYFLGAFDTVEAASAAYAEAAARLHGEFARAA